MFGCYREMAFFWWKGPFLREHQTHIRTNKLTNKPHLTLNNLPEPKAAKNPRSTTTRENKKGEARHPKPSNPNIETCPPKIRYTKCTHQIKSTENQNTICPENVACFFILWNLCLTTKWRNVAGNSLHAHYSENCFQIYFLTGVMYFGVLRAGPSWCLRHLDARRRSVGQDFDLIGAPSLLAFLSMLEVTGVDRFGAYILA